MKILSFVFATLISYSAMADFTGTWKGQGTFDDSEGTTVACKAMSFDISQTAQQITLNSGDADCDLFKLQWKPFTIEIQGNDLISNGDRVGTYADDFVFVKLVNPENGITSVYTLEMSDSGLTINETSNDAEGNILFSIEGLLNK